MRSSTFSLDFLVIGPLNPDETRGKVDPHSKSYAWVLVLWSFKNSGRWGFSLRFILWLRAILMARDARGPEWLFIRCQRLGWSGEIPRVVLNNMLCCWCDPLGSSKMDCRIVY